MEEIEPLTAGKPFFHVVFTKSQLKHKQLRIPAKVNQVLPSATVPVVLSYHGNEWEMEYLGAPLYSKRFDHGWKEFVDENDLKVGDGCVFELTDEPNDVLLRFKVQILRGDLPPEILARVNGESSTTPIVIDD